LLQLKAQLQRLRLRLRQAAGVLRHALPSGGPPGRARTLLRVLKLSWLAALAWRRLRPSPSSAH
jgi:hypothetical protein